MFVTSLNAISKRMAFKLCNKFLSFEQQPLIYFLGDCEKFTFTPDQKNNDFDKRVQITIQVQRLIDPRRKNRSTSLLKHSPTQSDPIPPKIDLHVRRARIIFVSEISCGREQSWNVTAMRPEGLHNSWTFSPLQVTQAPPNTNLIAATSAFISRSLPNVNAPVNDTNNAKIIDNKVIFVACLYSNLSISSSFSVYSTLSFILFCYFVVYYSVALEWFCFFEANLK